MKAIQFLLKGKKKLKEIDLNSISTFQDIAEKHFKSSLRDIVAVKVNALDHSIDLSTKIEYKDSLESLEWVDIESKEGLDILRHSTTHLMSQAVFRLYKDAKSSHGPTTEDGFFYDFDFISPISENNFEEIENEMKKIISEKLPVERELIPIKEAFNIFKKQNASYKLEILEELLKNNVQEVSVYKQGEFIDLCRGPHVPNTSYIDHFKLIKISGVYWKNDPSRRMLQRLYGFSFARAKDLKDYLTRIEELKKRDHRLIGKNLRLFHFDENSPGFPFWHDKGLKIYQSLETWIRKENLKRNYQEIKTPILLHLNLWKKTGHYEHFKSNMFFLDKDIIKKEDRNYAIKPMNCPGHSLIYKNFLHSYRDLPLKLSEFGTVHRNELSGVLHGLFRVRSFTQDDGHIFCREENLEEQIIEIIEYTLQTYKQFGFKSQSICLSTRDDNNYVGSSEQWEVATSKLEDALKKLNLPYKVKEGEAAFYGPKIEFNIQDSLGRDWQCGTVQIDFSIASRLDLSYRNEKNEMEHPIVIHRAILGSLERFIGILIEETAGNLPVYLSPIQVRIVPVHLETHYKYAEKIKTTLLDQNFRCDIENSDESLAYRVHKNQVEKIPYLIIIGDKEIKENKIAVRIQRSKGKMSFFENIDKFIDYINENLFIL